MVLNLYLIKPQRVVRVQFYEPPNRYLSPILLVYPKLLFVHLFSIFAQGRLCTNLMLQFYFLNYRANHLQFGFALFPGHRGARHAALGSGRSQLRTDRGRLVGTVLARAMATCMHEFVSRLADPRRINCVCVVLRSTGGDAGGSEPTTGKGHVRFGKI